MTLERGVDESHLSHYLCPPPLTNIDLLAIMVSLETLRRRMDLSTSRRRTSRLWAISFDPREKSRRTWTQPVRSHHHPFIPRGTLSKVEIRTFRGSTLGFNEYLARKLGLLTAASKWTIMTLWSIGTTLCSFCKRALFV